MNKWGHLVKVVVDNSMINKRIGLVVALMVFMSVDNFAFVKEVEMPLLSYHIDNTQTNREAPNKLDGDAVWVFNPGVLVGIDTRETTRTPGWSALIKGGFFQDCANETVVGAGGGARHKIQWTKNLFIDLNGYLLALNAVTRFDSEPDRETVYFPLANVGINYVFESGRSMGSTLTYIPKDKAIAARSVTPLLFLTVNMMF